MDFHGTMRDKSDSLLTNVGAAAFAGLGAYLQVSGQKQLLAQRHAILRSNSKFTFKARQATLSTAAITLVGLGVYRLLV